MKVLFIASEASPFAKTGGLGDVVGSLPKALLPYGADVRVIMPNYGSIPERFKSRMETIDAMDIRVGWRHQYCGLQRVEHGGVTYYFIDNEHYFKRDGLYGYGDEAERFAFFNRAVLEALPRLGFVPDILHGHDWQAGLISVFLKANYKQYPFYQSMKSVFTVHNLKYQGVFPRSVLQDLFALDEAYFTPETLEYYGNVNCMKGGLVFADRITTVSRSYAEEIQFPFYGEGMDGLLRRRRGDLVGIVNGIDTGLFDPQTDGAIFSPYRNSLRKKRLNKLKLQELLGLPEDESIPVIGIVTRLVGQKGLDLIERVLDDLLSLPIQLVVLGTGEAKYEEMFRTAQRARPDKVSAHITFDDELARRIYAGSDLFLMPSLFEPCGIGQLIAMRYRSVPIVRETGGLKDTVQPYREDLGVGTGFTFTHYNAHDMLYSIRKAVQLYADEEVWKRLVKNMAKQDFGWEASAKAYMQVYRDVVGEKAQAAAHS